MEAKDILTILRTPRVRVLGNDLAVFDTLGTAMIAAVVAQKYDPAHGWRSVSVGTRDAQVARGGNGARRAR